MFDRKYNHTKHAFFDGRQLVPLASGNKWSSSFMLAVLILPNGSVNVAHSGHLCPVQSAAFRTIVARAGRGYQVTTHDDDTDYRALKQLYRNSLDRDARTGMLPANHTAGPDHDDRHKHKVIARSGPSAVEKGNPTGVCAAPQVLAPGNALTTQFPAMLQGRTQMALTEVLVRSSDSPVEVNDASGSAQGYDHDAPDVPSCLTCQHQLREVLTKLVELRRNIVNLDGVKWDEGERARLYVAASELRALIAGGGKVATIVLGKQTVTEDYQVDVQKQVPRFKKPPPDKPVEMKTIKVSETRQRQVAKPREPAVSKDHLAADVAQLEKLVEDYRKAVHKQATERTAHPEFIEHDDHTTQRSLAALSNAETDARAEYDTNHMEALLARRIAVGKLIGGNAYNQERQVASDKARVPDRAKAATDKRQAEAEVDAFARDAAENELRKHAEDDARASAARRARATRTETARDDRSADALRTQAFREARTSSARHHHDDNVRFAAEEQEQSERLLALAIQLAQAFDTTIGHQLHLLITGEGSDPTSQTDSSDAYIG